MNVVTEREGWLFRWYHRVLEDRPGERTVIFQFDEVTGERVTQGTRVRARSGCYLRTVTLPVFSSLVASDGRMVPIGIEWDDPGTGCCYRIINFYVSVPLQEQFHIPDVVKMIVQQGFDSFAGWIEDLILRTALEASLLERVLLPFSSEHCQLERLWVELLAFFADLELPRHELLGNIDLAGIYYRAALGGEAGCGHAFTVEGLTGTS